MSTMVANADESGFVIDIGGISFDDLINTTITSVSKQEEKLQDAAAAVFVLSGEDIRRARVTNIPDALRLVPGVSVAQTNANTWSVNIRGISTGSLNNKLLILIDGRSVYDPLYAGTYWGVQDTPLQDIERIEVVRGPGGTLWGSNAVNGVINIITKNAAETLGGLVELGTGDEERAIGVARYGWKTAGGGHARTYAKYNERDRSHNPSGAKDDWKMSRAGFRADQGAEDNVSYTLQGDVYDAHTGPSTGAGSETLYRGANLLFRRNSSDADGSGSTIQAYWDYTELDVPTLEVKRNTLDLEYQRRHNWQSNHNIIWGLGTRFNMDLVSASGLGGIIHPESRDAIYNIFLQDTVDIPDANLRLTVGGKVERNDFTGTEIQPNIRLAWSGIERQTYWGAISRAVRTPSRLETDFPGFTSASRSTLDSEELISYEIGHRFYSDAGFSVELTAFVNDYDNLIVFERDFSKAFFVNSANALEGDVHGAELNGTWTPHRAWRLDGNVSYLEMDLKVRSGQSGLSATGVDQSSTIEGSDPHIRATLRSAVDLTEEIEFDTVLRYSEDIPGPGGLAKVPSYAAVDLGVTWKPSKVFELGLSGRNLFDSHQPEIVGADPATPTARNEIQRSVFGTATWRF